MCRSECPVNRGRTGFLTSYVKAHPQVDINTILPNEQNIQKVLDQLEARS